LIRANWAPVAAITVDPEGYDLVTAVDFTVGVEPVDVERNL
jgi:hypothetical protein